MNNKWMGIILGFLCIVTLAQPARVDASWLSDATGINIDLNREIGTGIGAMASPTIESFEQSGRRLIDETDKVAKARLDQMNDIIKQNLDRTDAILQARIAQMDTVAADRITQIDGMLKNRTLDVQNILLETDQRITEHIHRVDELTEKRLGNIDTIATKTTLAFEDGLTRFLLVSCLVIFAAAAIWRWFVVSTKYYEELKPSGFFSKSRLKWLKKTSWDLVPQLGLLCVSLVCIWAVYVMVIPSKPGAQLKELENKFFTGYHESMKAMDFRQAHYYAAQLQILRPGENRYRGYLVKADLIRDILTRPALYLSGSPGLAEADMRLHQASHYLGKDQDIDLEVAGAFLLWQSGRSRAEEFVAAKMCGKALKYYYDNRSDFLDTKEAKSKKEFVLKHLAANYVMNYLSESGDDNALVQKLIGNPTAWADYASVNLAEAKNSYLTEQQSEAPSLRTANPLNHIFYYNRQVAELYRKMVPAYTRMVSIHAEMVRLPEELPGFTVSDTSPEYISRNNAASEVISAWESFNSALKSSQSPLTSSAIIARTMFLNDAMYVRALSYLNRIPVTIPPEIEALPDRATKEKFIPPRIRWGWAQDAFGSLSATTNHAVSKEASEFFNRYEKDLFQFEDRLVKLHMIKRQKAANALTMSAQQVNIIAGETIIYSSKLRLFNINGENPTMFDAFVRNELLPVVGVDVSNGTYIDPENSSVSLPIANILERYNLRRDLKYL